MAEAGIKLYAGCSGSADDAVNALLSGTLSYEENPVCNHHGEHHRDHDFGPHHDCHHGECGHEGGHCHS